MTLDLLLNIHDNIKDTWKYVDSDTCFCTWRGYKWALTLCVFCLSIGQQREGEKKGWSRETFYRKTREGIGLADWHPCEGRRSTTSHRPKCRDGGDGHLQKAPAQKGKSSLLIQFTLHENIKRGVRRRLDIREEETEYLRRIFSHLTWWIKDLFWTSQSWLLL